jgi:hypothetical protein
MSFLDTVRGWFNIGGVKASLMVPPSIEEASKMVKGTITLSAKTDKKINKVKVELIESFSQGRGAQSTAREYTWGEKEVSGAMDMKAGEEKKIEFSLPFSPVKSSEEQLAKRDGALGALGKAAMFVENNKSTFKVVVHVDVEGAAFGASDSKEIRMS